MALETLIGVKRINELNIMTNYDRPMKEGQVDWVKFDEMRDDFPACVDHEKNMISFKIQNGPIKENGKNGCQLMDMVSVALRMLEELNAKFPCKENTMTIRHLEDALEWQERRTKDRELRGVEGLNEK